MGISETGRETTSNTKSFSQILALFPLGNNKKTRQSKVYEIMNYTERCTANC